MDKNTKNLIIILGSVGAAVIIAVVAFVLIYFGGQKANNIKELIDKGKYEEALEQYNDLEDNDKNKIDLWMTQRVDQVKQEYYEGKKNFSTASDVLKDLKKFRGVSKKAQKAMDEITLDNQYTTQFELAKEALEKGEYLEAYEQTQNIAADYRLYDDVVVLRTQCMDKYRAAMMERINQCAEDDVAGMQAIRDEALAVLPDDKEIIKCCKTRLDNYVQSVLTQAKTYADNGQYNEATDLLQSAIIKYDCPEFWSAMEGYAVDSLEADCITRVQEGKLLEVVADLMDIVEQDSKYQPLLDKYAKQLVDTTLADAKKYADQKDYENAIAVIEKANKVYECEEFKNGLELYKSKLPQKLTSIMTLPVGDDDYWVRIGDTTDAFGVTRYDVIYTGTYSGRLIYYLDGKYKALKGQIVCIRNKGEWSDDEIGLSIYGDGELLFSDTEINYLTEDYYIDVDVTNISQLDIYIYSNTILDAMVYIE